jgi:hypothetical protein
MLLKSRPLPQTQKRIASAVDANYPPLRFGLASPTREQRALLSRLKFDAADPQRIPKNEMDRRKAEAKEQHHRPMRFGVQKGAEILITGFRFR